MPQFGNSQHVDRQWIPARNVGSSTIPAYGAVVSPGYTWHDGQLVRSVRQTQEGDFLTYTIYLCGPQSIPAGQFGVVTAADKPIGNVPFGEGGNYGTLPGSYGLWAGLPGVSFMDASSVSRHYSSGVFWADAVDDWVNLEGNASYVMCRISPSEAGLADAITFPIYLPRNGQEKDPNVKSGNRVAWTIGQVAGQSAAVALNSLDEKIGAIRIVTSALSPPQGWRAYDFGARLLRGGTAGNTGGEKEHDHGISVVHGAAPEYVGPLAADIPTADNVPDHEVVGFIERFE